MSTIFVSKRTGRVDPDQFRPVVALAQRAFGLKIKPADNLDKKQQMRLLELWHKCRTDNDGVSLNDLSARERKSWEKLLSRAAGSDGNVFDAAQKQEKEHAEIRKLAARALRPDRTQREARGYQVRLLTTLSEFVNAGALTTAALGTLVLLLSVLESGDVSGIFGAKIEDGALVLHDDFGVGRRATMAGEPVNKSLEALKVAQLITTRRTGNRSTIVAKGPLLLAVESGKAVT